MPDATTSESRIPPVWFWWLLTHPLGNIAANCSIFTRDASFATRRARGSCKFSPAGEGDTPMPRREGGRYHILPDDCICGQYRDEYDRPIRWGLR